MSFTQKKNTPANAALAAELARLEPYFTHENQPYIRVPYSSRGAILSALRSSSPTATEEDVAEIVKWARSMNEGSPPNCWPTAQKAAAMLETLSRERDEAVRERGTTKMELDHCHEAGMQILDAKNAAETALALAREALEKIENTHQGDTPAAFGGMSDVEISQNHIDALRKIARKALAEEA